MQTSWVFDHMVKGTGEASRSSWPTGTEMGGGTVVDGTWSSGVLRPRSTLLSRSSGPGGAVELDLESGRSRGWQRPGVLDNEHELSALVTVRPADSLVAGAPGCDP